MSADQLTDAVTGLSIPFDLVKSITYIHKYLSEMYPPLVVDITPSDTTVLTGVLWIQVGTSGDVVTVDQDGNEATHLNLSIGEIRFGRFTKVKATGTTCTGITAGRGRV